MFCSKCREPLGHRHPFSHRRFWNIDDFLCSCSPTDNFTKLLIYEDKNYLLFVLKEYNTIIISESISSLPITDGITYDDIYSLYRAQFITNHDDDDYYDDYEGFGGDDMIDDFQPENSDLTTSPTEDHPPYDMETIPTVPGPVTTVPGRRRVSSSVIFGEFVESASFR
ncbi:hypothetical protein ADUPG1_002606, partial [Aduncisulcus paluster]